MALSPRGPLCIVLLLTAALAQMPMPPGMGGPPPMMPKASPDTNSLLNDLRSIQFPPAAQAGLGGVAAQGFGGMTVGPGGTFGSMGMPAASGGAFGSAGGVPPAGFGVPMGGAAMPPPSGFGTASGGMPMGGGMGAPLGGIGGGAFGLPPAGGAGIGGMMGMQQQASGAGFGGMMGLQQQPQQPPPSPGGDAGVPEDMDCATGPHAAVWSSVKTRFRALLSEAGAPLRLVDRDLLVSALDGAMADLKAASGLGPQSADECGLGKLCLQLLSVVTIDDPAALSQLFLSYEQIASPVLTLLLDVPWLHTSRSGWPFFGLLAQLNLRKHHAVGALNPDVVDGLDEPAARAFHTELLRAIPLMDLNAMDKASTPFLQLNLKGGSLGALTAMAAQAVSKPQPAERAALLQVVQASIQQVIGSAAELDLALSTQWPLWGLLGTSVNSVAQV
eukprot:gnl/TRDRNA2_/TRDRNA2_182627_c0_seq1.p1 gnl/TRDRNA2_/TRDRNA2_182627_c0~~gnl/TRDRNA2_/TRDRNA2_182627_c0_seq1.p1  ORF type:complete len:459 (-),score=97.50 gnl/TRDRNA2_/TRDRNA2_182627_c0_seq1:69-1403(-)